MFYNTWQTIWLFIVHDGIQVRKVSLKVFVFLTYGKIVFFSVRESIVQFGGINDRIVERPRDFVNSDLAEF